MYEWPLEQQKYNLTSKPEAKWRKGGGGGKNSYRYINTTEGGEGEKNEDFKKKHEKSKCKISENKHWF